MIFYDKVIFLDVDGVCNTHTPLPSGYNGIEYDKINLLNKLLDAVPEATIVISSAWRYMILRGEMTIKGFEYILLIHGLKCKNRVIGHTEADALVYEENHFDAKPFYQLGLKVRADQIRKFIKENEVCNYVVLDDLPLEIDNFVQTEGHIGLTNELIEEAIRILRGTSNG